MLEKAATRWPWPFASLSAAVNVCSPCQGPLQLAVKSQSMTGWCQGWSEHADVAVLSSLPSQRRSDSSALLLPFLLNSKAKGW